VTTVDVKHLEAQAARFIRITVLALAGQLLVLGHWPGWSALWALAIGAAETAVRQMYPTVPVHVVEAASEPTSTVLGGVGDQ